MKGIAVILLVSFTSFTCEQVVFSFNCIMKIERCKAKCMKDGCEGKMAAKHDKKKEASSPKCLDCPMFAVLIHELTNNYSTIKLFAKEKYARVEINPTSEFSPKQWKPPNDLPGFSS